MQRPDVLEKKPSLSDLLETLLVRNTEMVQNFIYKFVIFRTLKPEKNICKKKNTMYTV